MVLLVLTACACITMLAWSGRLWRRFSRGTAGGGGLVYAAWVGEILALAGVLTLPAAMMRGPATLNGVYGMFLAWVVAAALLVWSSYRPRSGAWQPLMIGAAATLVGALVGLGVEAVNRGTVGEVLIIAIVILLVAAGALGILIRVVRA
ncbi:hypothetical protein [Leifsonia aquatica]|uniref:hypothetical protein n=1 Tax=Leifsonia aquatica TaxID=144185 RepID=UPI003830B03B